MPEEWIQITQEEVLEFFKLRAVQGDCPSCQKNSWNVLVQEGGMVPTVPLQNPSGAAVFPSPTIPLVSLMCNHCAFVRLYGQVPIMEWVREKRRG